MYQQQPIHAALPAPGIPVGPNGFRPQALGRWSTGLCDCADDGSNCCITCLCPCITFGQIAEIVDKGTTSCGASGALYALIGVITGCQWIYSCTYRAKFRAQYSLPEEPCNDCILHFCCEWCSLCQMSRELRLRGFDPALGWHLNVEKQPALASTQPPVMQGAMMR